MDEMPQMSNSPTQSKFQANICFLKHTYYIFPKNRFLPVSARDHCSHGCNAANSKLASARDDKAELRANSKRDCPVLATCAFVRAPLSSSRCTNLSQNSPALSHKQKS